MHRKAKSRDPVVAFTWTLHGFPNAHSLHYSVDSDVVSLACSEYSVRLGELRIPALLGTAAAACLVYHGVERLVRGSRAG